MNETDKFFLEKYFQQKVWSSNYLNRACLQYLLDNYALREGREKSIVIVTPSKKNCIPFYFTLLKEIHLVCDFRDAFANLGAGGVLKISHPRRGRGYWRDLKMLSKKFKLTLPELNFIPECQKREMED